jgi:hypothetical protein
MRAKILIWSGRVLALLLTSLYAWIIYFRVTHGLRPHHFDAIYIYLVLLIIFGLTGFVLSWKKGAIFRVAIYRQFNNCFYDVYIG